MSYNKFYSKIYYSSFLFLSQLAYNSEFLSKFAINKANLKIMVSFAAIQMVPIAVIRWYRYTAIGITNQ